MSTSNFKVIPETRPFKTLSSVMRTDEAKPFLKFISLSDLFYQQIYNNEYEKSIQTLLQFINNNSGDDDEMNISYCFNFILETFFFLPKYREFFSPIIYYIYKDKEPLNPSAKITEFINKMIQIGKDKTKFINQIKILRLFCAVNIFFSQDDTSDDEKDDDDDNEYKLLLNIIQNDRIKEFKEYIANNSNFDFNEKITSYPSLFYYHNRGYLYSYKLSYIECCAAYGSKECFNFLLLNNTKISDLIFQFSIFGGNLEIIHSLDELSPSSFDYHFYISIIAHNLAISEWLLSNFKCEFFSPTDCVFFNDYRSFLFLVLNGVDLSCEYSNIFVNCSNYFSLNLLCDIPF